MKTNRIEEGKYQGYYWMSDETEPTPLMGRSVFGKELDPSINPFIVEAQLYDPENKVSYSVKYVDGQYIAHRWDNVSKDLADGENYILQEYYSNRLDSGEGCEKIKLIFLQHWVAKNDPACAGDINDPDSGMPVLQAKELFFVGF